MSDIPTGGRTAIAALTTMKLLPQMAATSRTPSSARRRSPWAAGARAETSTPAGGPAGVDSVRVAAASIAAGSGAGI
jgi:hypothetical protein